MIGARCRERRAGEEIVTVGAVVRGRCKERRAGEEIEVTVGAVVRARCRKGDWERDKS